MECKLLLIKKKLIMPTTNNREMIRRNDLAFFLENGLVWHKLMMNAGGLIRRTCYMISFDTSSQSGKKSLISCIR